MPYLATVSGPTRRGDDWVWTVDETADASNIEPTSEFSIVFPWRVFHLRQLRTEVRTAGSIATIQPQVGQAAGWALGGKDHIYNASGTDAAVQDLQTYRNLSLGAARTLYFRSKVNQNSGATAVIHWEIVAREGTA